MTDAAYRTLPLIGAQHALAEALLMQSLLRNNGHVCAPRFTASRFYGGLGQAGNVLRIDRDRERQFCQVISDDVCGPDGHVPTWSDSEHVDQRNTSAHREP